jgi:hypothetical protein
MSLSSLVDAMLITMLITCPPRPPTDLALSYSYETLPPNFSLVQNMAAGAFAGIAVRS